MADRFPLILNTSNNQIQEIASGDNLDLTGTGINNAGIITAGNVTIGAATTDLIVTGDARITGILTIGTSSLKLDGPNNLVNVGTALTLGHTQGLQFHTQNLHSAGFEVNQVNASGIITATGADINGDIDVDGLTNLDNVSIAGISTHSDHIHLLDDKRLRLGSAANGDAVLLHNGSDAILDNQTGNLFFRSASTHLQSLSGDDKIVAEANGVVELYFSGNKRFETTSAGILVHGNGTVTGNLSVGGVLTYEDVTNVDSIGIITARSSIKLDADGSASSNFLSIGADDDLKIFHQSNVDKIESSANGFHIRQINNGDLHIHAGANTGTANNRIVARAGGKAELYYGGALKLSTETGGINITGVCTATSFVGDGSNLTGITQTTINNNTNNYVVTATGTANTLQGESTLTYDGNKLTSKAIKISDNGSTSSPLLNVKADDHNPWAFAIGNDTYSTNDHQGLMGYQTNTGNFVLRFQANSEYKDLYFRQSDGTTHRNMFAMAANGQVALYHQGNAKLETRSTGVSVYDTLSVGTGSLQSSNVMSIRGGVSNQVNIADGNNTSWGLLLTQSQAAGGYHATTNSGTDKPCAIVNVQNDALHFGTSNTLRWTIDHSGHFYPGGNGNLDIGKSSNRVRNIYTSDLHLSNEAKGANDVDGTWGDYTIQEGESDLFLINNRNGKKYKFNLTEVS